MTTTALSDVQTAISGDKKALEQLLLDLIPAVRARVIQTLIRLRYRAKGRDLQQEVEDLVHEAIMYLIERDCRILSLWDPEKGMNLESFVCLVTGRFITKLVTRDKSSPWTEDPTSMDLDESDHNDDRSRAISFVQATGNDADPEDIVTEKELFVRLVERLSNKLTPLGFQLFQMICVQSLSVEEVCTRTELSPDAVYAWRSRLIKAARKTMENLLSENGALLDMNKKGVAIR